MINNDMKTYPVANLIRLVLRVTFRFVLAGSLFAAVAGDLVPFKGNVSGEIPFSIDPNSGAFLVGSEIEPVNMHSSHFGLGTQEFSEISFGLDGASLTCAGTADCIAANGDILRLEFVLTTDGAFFLDEAFTYKGFYWILDGGTGRFAFPKTGGLGKGDILNGEGIADFDFLTGSGVLSFSHDFEGTIAKLRGPSKNKN